jgi:hypothetical protein
MGIFVPQPHVGEGRITVGDLVSGGHMHDGDVVGAAGGQQTLHAGDDLIVHLVLVAGEGIARPRPGIGQINADQRGAFAKADPALEPVLLIDLRAFIESLLKHRVEGDGINVAHREVLFSKAIAAVIFASGSGGSIGFTASWDDIARPRPLTLWPFYPLLWTKLHQ